MVRQVLEDEFKTLDQLMREWQINYCVIDMDPAVMEARRFARRFHGFVSLCRYRRGQAAKEITVSDEDTGRASGDVRPDQLVELHTWSFQNQTEPYRIATGH